MTMDVYGGRKPLEVLLHECVVKIDYGIEDEDSEWFLTFTFFGLI